MPNNYASICLRPVSTMSSRVFPREVTTGRVYSGDTNAPQARSKRQNIPVPHLLPIVPGTLCIDI